MDADSLPRYLETTTLLEKEAIQPQIYQSIADKPLTPEQLLRILKATVTRTQWISDDENGRGPSIYDLLGFHSENASVVEQLANNSDMVESKVECLSLLLLARLGN